MSHKRGRDLEDGDSDSEVEVEDGIARDSDATANDVKARNARTKRSKKYSRHEIGRTATWTGNKKIGQYITLPRYSKLLDQDAADLVKEENTANRASTPSSASPPVEVYGIIPWTASELELFFNYLGRKGRDDLPGIARGIGTKGELEVADLLRRLKEGYLDRQLTATNLSLPDFHEIPAAMEMGAEIEEVLDLAAGAAVCDEAERELLAEEEKVGAEFAVLDGDNANVFYDEDEGESSDEDADDDADDEANTNKGAGTQDKRLRAHSTDNSQLDEPTDNTYPDLNQATLTAATQVLDLPRLLELSQYVFMNSAEETSNWQSLQRPQAHKTPTPRSKSRSRTRTPQTPKLPEDPLIAIPGIYQTTLLDLYTLVLDTTTRIASTAHFMASSRIRATDNRSQRSIRRVVKQTDVKAALDILGSEHNPWNFWTKCPRRCGVSVYGPLRKGKRRKNLNYDEVEKLLASKRGRVRKREDDDEDSDGSNGDNSAAATARNKDRALNGEATEEEEDDFADDASAVSFSTRASSAASNSSNPDSSPDPPDPFPDPTVDRNSSLSPEAATRDTHEHDVHSYADVVDLAASKAEEERLRAFLTGAKKDNLSHQTTRNAKLGKSKGKGVEGMNTPPPPKKKKMKAVDEEIRRKTVKELRDWRDWMGYKAEWERYPRPVRPRSEEGESVVETIEDGNVHPASKDVPILDGTGEEDEDDYSEGDVRSWEMDSTGTRESRQLSEEGRGRRRVRT